eukprot:CAMPEP_0182471806 /NCGR_PEP_ID=MMETSP1319-20130603/21008_1 /TAXON_ID=172717 /ORGANISM="Bolidomonas pacifica, Strain RCC208" /LENGTH=152 /DNA_ID=CAMNT_0024672405 /DNA_START=48 /DNA_END=503 /DNA_ORIENTATION=+
MSSRHLRRLRQDSFVHSIDGDDVDDVDDDIKFNKEYLSDSDSDGKASMRVVDWKELVGSSSSSSEEEEEDDIRPKRHVKRLVKPQIDTTLDNTHKTEDIDDILNSFHDTQITQTKPNKPQQTPPSSPFPPPPCLSHLDLRPGLHSWIRHYCP